MSINNYIRPQLTIKQLLDVTPNRVADRLNPVVIGPAYHVETLDLDNGVTFSSLAFTAPYSNLPAGAVVDLASVNLFANALELNVRSSTGTIPDFNEPNVVQLTTQSHINDLRLGDLFYVNPTADSSKKLTRRIVGLRGVTTASSYDNTPNESSTNPSLQATLVITETPTNVDFNITTAGTFSGLVGGATYAGKFGDLFTIYPTTAGAAGVAVVSIRSNSGLYDADNVPTTASGSDYVINSSYFGGLTVTLVRTSARNLVDGDVISFQIAAPYTPASTNGVISAGDLGSGYTGSENTNYLIRVIAGGALGVARVQITDTSGVDVVQTYTVSDNIFYSLGSYGLRFKFNNAAGDWNVGLRTGDVYVVSATTATESTSTFDKVVLDGTAADTSAYTAPLAVTWNARVQFDGVIDPKSGLYAGTRLWTAGTSNVSVAAALALTVGDRAGLVAVPTTGSITTTYRAIVQPALNESLISLSSYEQIVAEFGPITLDNTLAFGAAKALSGAQGKVVYAVRVAADTVEAFAAAFAKISNTDSVYVVVPLSTLDSVKQLAASHVVAMSAEAVKNFRRAYVGIDSPVGGYGILTKTSNGTNFTATVASHLGTNTRVVSTGANFVSLGVIAGNEFRYGYAVDAWGVETFSTYKVAEVLGENELILASGPVAPSSLAQRFELWAGDNADSKVAFLVQNSSSYANRRLVNVWCENGTSVVNGVTVIIPNMFVAAEIAGLRCAVLPQQGLTNTEIASISNAPAMYISYTQAQLNAIAASGTFIVTQDVHSGAVYIRHQLTTRTTEGSLYYEDSVGVNLDNTSYGVKDILSSYVGRRNANNETLSEIRKAISLYLTKQTMTSPSNSIGPALIGFTDPEVSIDATFKDTINVYSNLTMPLPLNQINVTLRGSTQV